MLGEFHTAVFQAARYKDVGKLFNFFRFDQQVKQMM